MRLLFTLVTVFVLVLLGFASTYTVQEYEQVIVTRFGEIQGDAVSRAGLHFKVPFVDEVHRFDKRWLEWDGDPNQIPTGDKKYIWVDHYARWRISDPVLFYKRLRDEQSAQSRLDDIIDGEIRTVIANHNVIEIVRTSSRVFELGDLADAVDVDPDDFQVKLGREALRRLVQDRTSAVAPNYGIELADVGIKRINYVESVQTKVFDRMISERKRIAARYRSEGQGKSAEIRGRIDRDLKKIQSEAYRQAQEIRGKADGEAARISAEAYEQAPALYEFLKSLETYRKTIDSDTTLLLSTDSKLFEYLKSPG